MANDTFKLQFGEGPRAIVLDDQQKDVNYHDIANCSIPVFSTPPVYQMSWSRLSSGECQPNRPINL